MRAVRLIEHKALKPGERKRWPGEGAHPLSQGERSPSRRSPWERLLEGFSRQGKVEETHLVELVIPKYFFIGNCLTIP